MRSSLAGLLLVFVTAVCAQDASDSSIDGLRLLPPTVSMGDTRRDFQAQFAAMPALVRQRHPRVFDEAANGTYLVSLTLDFEGNVQRSSATLVEPANVDAAMASAMPLMDGVRVFSVTFQKDHPLPDGSQTKNDVTVISLTAPPGFDESRALSRVHDAVRRAHADVMLAADGPLVNRLTVLMNEDGSIQRHLLEQSRRDELRRAPLEDQQFAERMAARIANVLSIDPAGLGVVGFTYVTNAEARVPPRSPEDMANVRVVLVQYAWPRKSGESGPSAPMTAMAQRATRFDEQAALRLAEHHFPDAFTGASPEAGTPTIALSPQGEVIATGRLQYGSGLNHERIVSEQLVPGIRTGAFVSPRLTNAAGRSAVVSFVWQADTP